MKNENTATEAERIAKAFNQLANAIENLCKAIRKTEVGLIPKTAPLPNPKGLHESNIDQRIKEWVEAIEIWKNNLINKNSKTKHEPNDPLAGMHVDEKKYPDYVCIKDYSDSKKGDIFKYQFVNKHLKYAYENCTNKKTFCYSPEYFKNDPEHFVTDEQWNILNGYIQKDGTVFVSENSEVDQDKIEFHDKDGFAWFVITKSNKFWEEFAKKKAEEINQFEIKKNADGSYYFEIEFGKIEQQTKFDLLEENQIIEFKLRNGKRYKAQVLRDLSTETYYLNSNGGSNAIYFHDLNQMDYKNNLNKLYGNNDVYPSAPDLECLTNDLNTLIQLPDLSNKETPLADLPKVVIAETKTCDENIIIQHTKLDEKFYNDQGLEFKCEELIAKFMPLVTKWKFEGNTIVNQEETYSGVWSYSDNNKRKAAIKIAILHCELLLCKIIIEPHFINTNAIKNQLEKMISQ